MAFQHKDWGPGTHESSSGPKLWWRKDQWQILEGKEPQHGSYLAVNNL